MEEAKVVVYFVHSGQSVVDTLSDSGGKREVNVVNTPFGLVTTTIPESVSIDPDSEVTKVVVYVVHSGQSVDDDSGKREIDVVNAPFGLVVTTTIPESVSSEPSDLEVAKVVVYFVHSGQPETEAEAAADFSGKREVLVVNAPFVSVTMTTPESVSTEPSELEVAKVVVYFVHSGQSVETDTIGKSSVEVVNAPSGLVVTTTMPDSVSVNPSDLEEANVVVYFVHSGQPVTNDSSEENGLLLSGKREVEVVKEPSGFVVTTTIPESVSADPSEFDVANVVVYLVHSGQSVEGEADCSGKREVDVVKDPFGSVVTTTTPDSVSTGPPDLDVAKVVVYLVQSGQSVAEDDPDLSGKREVEVVKTPFGSVVTTTTPESVWTEPPDLEDANVVVYRVHSGQSEFEPVSDEEAEDSDLSGKREVVVVNSPFGLVVTTTIPESVSAGEPECEVANVVVYLVHSVQSEAEADCSGKREVVVVKSPFGFVVTTTTPESVSIDPSDFEVAKVVVYLVHSGHPVTSEEEVMRLLSGKSEVEVVWLLSEKREVEVVNAPLGFVVTMTMPESVSAEPSDFEVAKVVVYLVHSGQSEADAEADASLFSGKREVVVVNRPFGLVVTMTIPESVSTPSDLEVAKVVVYLVHSGQPVTEAEVSGKRDVVVVNSPFGLVVTTTIPESVSTPPDLEVAKVVVYLVHSGQSVFEFGSETEVTEAEFSGKSEVVVVNSPFGLVVTTTIPESVSTGPPDSDVAKVVVYLVHSVQAESEADFEESKVDSDSGADLDFSGKREVVVVNAPFGLVVTTTIPESVSVEPSDWEVAKVVVYLVHSGQSVSEEDTEDFEEDFSGKRDVEVFNAPSGLVVTTTMPESVSTDPSDFEEAKVVVYRVHPGQAEEETTDLEAVSVLEPDLSGKREVEVVKAPFGFVVMTTTPESVSMDPPDFEVANVVVYLVLSGQAEADSEAEAELEPEEELEAEADLLLSGKREVVVVKAPFGLVVMTTTPESVSTEPDSEVANVVVYFVHSGQSVFDSEADLDNSEEEADPTDFEAEEDSTSGLLAECDSEDLESDSEADLSGNRDVVVVNTPFGLVVTTTIPESVSMDPSDLDVKVVVYLVHSGHPDSVLGLIELWSTAELECT